MKFLYLLTSGELPSEYSVNGLYEADHEIPENEYFDISVAFQKEYNRRIGELYSSGKLRWNSGRMTNEGWKDEEQDACVEYQEFLKWAKENRPLNVLIKKHGLKEVAYTEMQARES